MNAVIARIALRYIAAALVSYGVLSADIGDLLSVDADVSMWMEIGVGLVIGLITEGWYALAKRMNWAT